MKQSLLLGCGIVTLILSSCASYKDATINHLVLSSKCNQQNLYSYTVADFPLPLQETTIDTLLKEKISVNSLLIANTIGIIPYLNEYAKLKSTPTKHSTIEQQLRLLELKQVIYHYMSNASLGISAVSSELDCEDERVSQIANYLTERESNIESKLTIGAIVLGATGGILSSGLIKNNNTSNTVAITTGIGEAALGLTMLFNKQKINFYHSRNVLKDIWEGPETSTLFPSFIWYYLNHEDDDKSSLRKEMIEKWVQFGQIDDDSDNLADLYFKNGGKYTADELNNRANMYDQLETQVYLLKQKLMVLTSEIDNF